MDSFTVWIFTPLKAPSNEMTKRSQILKDQQKPCLITDESRCTKKAVSNFLFLQDYKKIFEMKTFIRLVIESTRRRIFLVFRLDNEKKPIQAIKKEYLHRSLFLW